MNLADVQTRPLGVDESATDAWQRWQAESRDEPVAKVRRLLQFSGPLVDLRSGTAVNQSLTAGSIIRLLQMTRRSVAFLPADEEATS